MRISTLWVSPVAVLLLGCSAGATKPTQLTSTPVTTWSPITPDAPLTAVQLETLYSTPQPFFSLAPSSSAPPEKPEPPCRKRQLKITWDLDDFEGASGTQGYFIVLTNISRGPCSLQGYPSVYWTTATGAQAPAGKGSMIHGLDLPTPPLVNLKRGERATFFLESSSNCDSDTEPDPDPPPYVIRVQLRGGTTVVRAEGSHYGIEMDCGFWVSHFSRWDEDGVGP